MMQLSTVEIIRKLVEMADRVKTNAERENSELAHGMAGGLMRAALIVCDASHSHDWEDPGEGRVKRCRNCREVTREIPQSYQ